MSAPSKSASWRCGIPAEKRRGGRHSRCGGVQAVCASYGPAVNSFHACVCCSWLRDGPHLASQWKGRRCQARMRAVAKGGASGKAYEGKKLAGGASSSSMLNSAMSSTTWSLATMLTRTRNTCLTALDWQPPHGLAWQRYVCNLRARWVRLIGLRERTRLSSHRRVYVRQQCSPRRREQARA